MGHRLSDCRRLAAGRGWRWLLAPALFCLGTPAAYGLSLRGVGIRPAHPRPPDAGWFVYQLKPGESVTDAVLVVNDTDQPVMLELNAVDYEPTDIGAFGVKGSGAEQVGIGKWTRLATTTLELPAGGKREVPFILTIPPEADVGEHAGAIMAQSAQAKPASQISGAYITTRVGARIYNTVPGELVRALKLLGFSVHDNKKTGHYEFTVRAKNVGNVSVSPQLKLHLDGWGLVTVPPPDDPELADFQGFSLFGLQRFLPKVRQNNWQLARDAEVETYFRWRKPYLGRFSTTLTLEYERTPGNPEVLRSQTLSLMVLPWPETGYGLGGFGFLLAFIVAWMVWRKVHGSGRGWKSYVVNAGDTLTLIAARSQVSWKRLAKVNRLKKPYVVSPGDKILVPPDAKLGTERATAKAASQAKAIAAGRPPQPRNTATRSRGSRFLPLTVILVVGAALLTLAGTFFVRSVLRAPTPLPELPPVVQPVTASATSTEPLTLPAPTTTATTTPVAPPPAKDTVAITVLNGSGVPGLAAEVVAVFRQAGYQQLSAGNADAFTYQGAVIQFRTGLKGAADDLQKLLRDRYQKFTLEEFTTTTASDLTVILGHPAPR